MADLDRIKRNVSKMAAQNAPESDIDGYIASEGVTVDDVRNYKAQPQNPFTFARDAVESGQVEAPKGFQDRMAQDYEKFRQGTEKATENNYSLPEQGARAGVKGASLALNTIGNVIGSGARYVNDVIPDEMKLLARFEAEKIKNNPVVQAAKEPAMQGAQYAAKEYREFAKDNPRAAFNIETGFEGFGVIPVAKIVGVIASTSVEPSSI
jgi:hypothetical protein